MIQHLFWLVGSIFIGLLQNVLVVYNSIVILIEIVAMQAIKLARASFVWIAIPLPYILRRRKRIVQVTQQLRSARTYEEFLLAARELDQLQGSQSWREERESDEYDFELVEETTKRLRKARRRGDVHGLVFALRTIMSRSYGGIDRAALYKHAHCGTKIIVEKFISEVVVCLEAVAASADLSNEIKLEFFETCRLNVGRTALALSGGGALAMSHMGVVKTLIQAGLLPRVISGTSGGSIVAAMMAMSTDEELLADIITPSIVSKFNVKFFEPLQVQIWRFFTSSLLLGAPRMMDSEFFEAAVKAYFGEMTFGSAFAKTGRIVNITITVHYGGSSFPQALVLNYLTSPQVLLYSAVAASCALPGLMRPVTLMAKDYKGVTVPYHPVAGVRSIDGSMNNDIPAEQMALMFHCNRTIVSQTNPHIVPFLKDGAPRSRSGTNILSRALYAVEYWLTLDVQSRTKYLAKMRLLPKFFGAEFSNVFLQKYSGDVTIAPYQPFLSQWKALSQPTEADMVDFIVAGQRATWPRIAHIRSLLAVEKKLSSCARRFVSVPGALSLLQPKRGRHQPSDSDRSTRFDVAAPTSPTGIAPSTFPPAAINPIAHALHPPPDAATPDDAAVQEAANLLSAGAGDNDWPLAVRGKGRRKAADVGAGDPSDDMSSSARSSDSSDLDGDDDRASALPPGGSRANSPTLYWRGSGHHVMQSYGNLSQAASVSGDRRTVRSVGHQAAASASLYDGEDERLMEDIGQHFSVPRGLLTSSSFGPGISFQEERAAAGLTFGTPPRIVSSSRSVGAASASKKRMPSSVSFADQPSPESLQGNSPMLAPADAGPSSPLLSSHERHAGPPMGMFVIGSPIESSPVGPPPIVNPRLHALQGFNGRMPMTPPPPAMGSPFPPTGMFSLDPQGMDRISAASRLRDVTPAVAHPQSVAISLGSMQGGSPKFPMTIDFSPTNVGMAERADVLQRAALQGDAAE